MFFLFCLIAFISVTCAKYEPYTEEQFKQWLDDWNKLTFDEMHLVTKLFWADEIASDHEIDVLESQFASTFYANYTKQSELIVQKLIASKWNLYTNLTQFNKKSYERSVMLSANFSREKINELKEFNWRSFKDENLKRAFLRAVIVIGDSGMPEGNKVLRWKQLKESMNTMYTTSKINLRNKKLSLDPNITGIFQSSRNYSYLSTIWKLWRDNSGKKIRKLFPEYIELSNYAVKGYDFADYGEYSRSSFEVDDLPEQLDEIYSKLKPLYKLLHNYVRHKLRQVYGLSETEGVLPAHIMGDLWAQQWHNIFEDIKPYKNNTLLDVTPKMKEKNLTPKDLFLIAEEFYTSLGLDPLPESFWNNSLIEKPNDGREVNCHASAWDFYDGKDFRIKMCTKVSMNDMFTIHHEMGHIQYYMSYKDQPFHFKEGANPGFHEALGDLMTLSVMTPSHLHKIGLIDQLEDNKEQDINFLLFSALRNIAFAPFSLAVEKWRWNVFANKTTPDRYNFDWWKLRCDYQGIVPPVDRTEEDFDPGSKYHIAAGIPYDRYFVSLILTFQFHDALCKVSNHKGPLHKCDIYESREAGDRLRKMMEKGSSESWNKVLYEFTGGKTDKMDPTAILEYFRPLHEWLIEQNLPEQEWNCEQYLDYETKMVKGYMVNKAYRDSSFSFGLKLVFLFCFCMMFYF